jgi:hypothetical protein
MKHCILATLIAVSCSHGHTARASRPVEPITLAPPEHDASAPVTARQVTQVDLTSYACVCNGMDRGTCSTVYVQQSEATWYVNFSFQGVTVLKRANECKPLVKQERQS